MLVIEQTIVFLKYTLYSQIISLKGGNNHELFGSGYLWHV